MLIDSTHRRWIAATLILALLAVAVHTLLGLDRPGGLTGGTMIGLWYGLIGSGLMIFAGLLSAHRRLPVRRWLGSRQFWLRGHIWLGLLSLVFILCHSGYHWGGPLEIALWIVLIGTIGTGILGLVIQAVIPRQLTNRIAAEAPYEQLGHLCDVMRREADELVSGATGQTSVDADARGELKQAYEEKIRPFLQEPFDRQSPLAHSLGLEVFFNRLRSEAGMDVLTDTLNRLQTMCDERRQLGRQARLHFWLHVWLLVHIPITVALLILGVAHAVMSVYY